MVKTPPAHAGDTEDVGSVPGSGRSPGGGNVTPLQCSCLENPIDRGAWRIQSMGLQRFRHTVTFHSDSISLLFESSQKLGLHLILSLSLSFYLKIPYIGGQSSQGHFNQHSSSTWETIKLTQIIKVVAVVFDTTNKIL